MPNHDSASRQPRQHKPYGSKAPQKGNSRFSKAPRGRSSDSHAPSRGFNSARPKRDDEEDFRPARPRPQGSFDRASGPGRPRQPGSFDRAAGPGRPRSPGSFDRTSGPARPRSPGSFDRSASPSRPRSSDSYDRPSGPGRPRQPGSFDRTSGPARPRQPGNFDRPSGPARPRPAGSFDRPSHSRGPSSFKPKARHDNEYIRPHVAKHDDEFRPKKFESFSESDSDDQEDLFHDEKPMVQQAPRAPRQASDAPRAPRPVKYKHSMPVNTERDHPVKRHASSIEPRAKSAFKPKESVRESFSTDRDAFKKPAARPTKVDSQEAPSEVGEVKVYGLHACKALFEKRPDDLIRLYCLEAMIPKISKLIKHCVDTKKAYHVVTAEELQRITDSIHHEGVCLLTKEKPSLSLENLLVKLDAETGPVSLIYLEGVENPHNIGSLIRICAHFGVTYLLTDAKSLSSLPAATYRVAKGGVEEITCVPLSHPHKALEQLKEKGFTLIASSSHATNSLYKNKLPTKAVFLFGSETHGIADSFLKRCASVFTVPGSGAVESLNVSITSALFLGEFWRQHGLSS